MFSFAEGILEISDAAWGKTSIHAYTLVSLVSMYSTIMVVRIHLQRLLEFKQGCVHVAAFCAA